MIKLAPAPITFGAVNRGSQWEECRSMARCQLAGCGVVREVADIDLHAKHLKAGLKPDAIAGTLGSVSLAEFKAMELLPHATGVLVGKRARRSRNFQPQRFPF